VIVVAISAASSVSLRINAVAALPQQTAGEQTLVRAYMQHAGTVRAPAGSQKTQQTKKPCAKGPIGTLKNLGI